MPRGGLFSVALSIGLPQSARFLVISRFQADRPAVSRRNALWSSDFPQKAHEIMSFRNRLYFHDVFSIRHGNSSQIGMSGISSG
jgi:hypothetical protein